MALLETLIANVEGALDYDLIGSQAKCRIVISGLRAIRLRRPKSVSIDGNPVAFEDLMQMLNEAQIWLQQNPGSGAASGSTTYYDMSDLRR